MLSLELFLFSFPQGCTQFCIRSVSINSLDWDTPKVDTDLKTRLSEASFSFSKFIFSFRKKQDAPEFCPLICNASKQGEERELISDESEGSLGK